MVMYYLPEMDYDGNQADKHPFWPATRWLANWEHGEWQGQVVMTEAQVQKWIERYGPFDDR